MGTADAVTPAGFPVAGSRCSTAGSAAPTEELPPGRPPFVRPARAPATPCTRSVDSAACRAFTSSIRAASRRRDSVARTARSQRSSIASSALSCAAFNDGTRSSRVTSTIGRTGGSALPAAVAAAVAAAATTAAALGMGMGMRAVSLASGSGGVARPVSSITSSPATPATSVTTSAARCVPTTSGANCTGMRFIWPARSTTRAYRHQNGCIDRSVPAASAPAAMSGESPPPAPPPPPLLPPPVLLPPTLPATLPPPSRGEAAPPSTAERGDAPPAAFKRTGVDAGGGGAATMGSEFRLMGSCSAATAAAAGTTKGEGVAAAKAARYHAGTLSPGDASGVMGTTASAKVASRPNGLRTSTSKEWLW